jgi:hypothetical protein
VRLTDYFKACSSTDYFNAPYQLAILPSTIPDMQKRLFMSDHPSDALRSSFGPLKHGDIVIMGTAGLFDNVFIEEMSAILEQELHDVCLSMVHTYTIYLLIIYLFLTYMKQILNYWPVPVDANGDALHGGADLKHPSAIYNKEWHGFLQHKLQGLADAIVRQASALAVSSRTSPFGQQARKHGWTDHFGGCVLFVCDQINFP